MASIDLKWKLKAKLELTLKIKYLHAKIYGKS